MAQTFAPAPNAPFLRLLAPLLTGILLAGWITIPVNWLTGVLFFLLFLLLCCRNFSYSYQPYFGMLVCVFLMVAGITRVAQKARQFVMLPEGKYFAIAEDYPEAREKTYKLTCELIQQECKIILWLPKEDKAANIMPGEVIVFTGEPATIENNGNPYEFDYKDYLNSKQIGYQLFLNKNQYHLLQSAKVLNISRRSMILRSQIIDRLHKAGLKEKSLALVASIAFGARDEVDKDDVQSFTNTGVIHVLAVSWLNVGLIFIILDYLLAFLKKKHGGRLLYFLIMYVAIWAYALITGMSASILRAAFMFSFVLTGMAFSRKSNIFNTLACSVFILLICDPALLSDVGFQLSYAAVLAIVLIQPKIYHLFWFRNKIADKFWLMIAVTFAAQLGTLPLTLSYFHQFPFYFWIANIIVIPLVTLILYLSFVLLALSFISQFLSFVVVWLIQLAIRIVLETVHLVENFPVAVLHNLYPTLAEIILAAGICYLLWNFARTKKAINLTFMLIIMICLAFELGWKRYERLTYREMIFFNIPGTMAVVLSAEREAIVLFDRCNQAETKLAYAMRPYFGWKGIRKIRYVQITDSLRLHEPGLAVVGNRINFYGCTVQVQIQERHQVCQHNGNLALMLDWHKVIPEGALPKTLRHLTQLSLTNCKSSLPLKVEGALTKLVINKAVRVKILAAGNTASRAAEISYYR